MHLYISVLIAAFVTSIPAHAGFVVGTLRPDAVIAIDGRIDETAWASARVNERFHQFEPEDGRPAPQAYRTAVQVLADDNWLVFAIRAWNPPIEQVNGSLARRDKVARDQDYIGVYIDPSGHGRSAQFVRVNVAGVLADGIYRSDEDEEDLGPDYPIEAAVTRLDDGYSVEVRWPLSSLRFPYRGARSWRVMVERSIPGADGLLLLSAPLRKDAINFIAEMEELDGMTLVAERARDKAYWEVRPELTLRGTRGPGYRTKSASLGADINARPRADLVFNATLNPDFSQVEIDEPTSAGASQIALSLPEKRAFFLESADVLGMRLPAFYSRTVTDPRWGARLTWRGSGADATVLSLADRAGGIVMRGTPYVTNEHVSTYDSRATLLRARLHAPNAVTGVFVSRRDYGDGGANTVIGGDLQRSISLFADGHTQATFGLMHSRTTAWSDSNSHAQRTATKPGNYLFTKLHHSSDTWINAVQVEAITPDFFNDNGFLPQSGIVKAKAEINRRLGPSQLLSTYETEAHLGLHEDRSLNNEHFGKPGEVVRRWIRPGLWGFTGRQTRIWSDLAFDRQRARSGGTLHRTPGVYIGFESSPSPWLIRVAGDMTLGRQLDAEADKVGRGGNVQLEMNLRFALPAGWSLESDHRFNRAWIKHADRQDFTDHAWRWVGTLHTNVHSSVRVIAQNAGAGRAYGTTGILDPWTERSRHRSLLYRYIYRHGRSLSLGATSDANGALPGAVKGLTVKLEWEG